MAVSRRCSQSGLGPFFTPLIMRPTNSGQAELLLVEIAA